MNFLITGGAGYLGSTLVRRLLEASHGVRVVDIDLSPAASGQVEMIRADLRRTCRDDSFTRRLLDDCDCLVHLAAVTDPATFSSQPDYCHELNVEVTAALAREARGQNVRMLFASSGAVYGRTCEPVGEGARQLPLTAYASSKAEAERRLRALRDSTWNATALRCGTLFGCTARTRFELVVNKFSLLAAKGQPIELHGGGSQWRPFVHVDDCARAFLAVSENPALSDAAFNVGPENLRISDLIGILERQYSALEVHGMDTTDDNESGYRMCMKALKDAVGFEPQHSVESGMRELARSL